MESPPSFHIALRTQPGLSSYHDSFLIEGEPPTRLTLWKDAAPGRRNVLEAHLDFATLTLRCLAHPDVWHYFRWADGTLKPLPPHPQPLTFSPGDAYIALSPSAQQVSNSPAIARFLHLRDYFNAEKLVGALLAHLVENAGIETFLEDVTVLIIEAR